MTKGELIKALSKETDYTTKSIRDMLDALAKVVSRALTKDGAVDIPGIVALKIVATKATKPRMMHIFGEMRRVKGKPAGRKLKARPKAALKAAALGGRKKGR